MRVRSSVSFNRKLLVSNIIFLDILNRVCNLRYIIFSSRLTILNTILGLSSIQRILTNWNFQNVCHNLLVDICFYGEFNKTFFLIEKLSFLWFFHIGKSEGKSFFFFVFLFYKSWYTYEKRSVFVFFVFFETRYACAKKYDLVLSSLKNWYACAKKLIFLFVILCHCYACARKYLFLFDFFLKNWHTCSKKSVIIFVFSKISTRLRKDMFFFLSFL